MYSTDEEFFEALKKVFNLLPNLFVSDIAISITDREQFVLVKQAKTFNLNIQQGIPIVKDGISEAVIRTKRRQQKNYPKEAFGFPIIAYAVPVINTDTNNVVGTITYASSLEKEQDVIQLVNKLNGISEQYSSLSKELVHTSEKLLKNSETVTKLADDAQAGITGMDGIVDYIKGVADATNMLGINAAIESARAGEHGRGFSIVANEIRKLAQNSKASTTQISDNLKCIKKDINEILTFLSEFSDASKEQSSQAEKMSNGSELINEISTKLLALSEKLNN